LCTTTSTLGGALEAFRLGVELTGNSLSSICTKYQQKHLTCFRSSNAIQNKRQDLSNKQLLKCL
ncbi:MAG: hypothetical protein QGG94_02330, partial [Prochlorococcaceae cyanobacterium ETNP1_MAG_9]|nr:hypothetical protein [Prochlorococcaceae cyanobacterium ETNP1_MAG_9]